MKKLIYVLLCLLFVMPAVGCREDTDVEVDTTKTQLYIGALDSGISIDFLRQTAKEFEEYYKDEPFEDGKKGVQIIIDPGHIGDFEGAQVFTKIKSSRDAVFYTQTVDYYQFVQAGYLADLSDIMKEDLSVYGDAAGSTILGKIDTQLQSFLNVDNKYYAIPWYSGYYGLYYDVDLFEKNLYYFAEGKTADGMDLTADDVDLQSLFVTSKDAPRSLGPDGKTGEEGGIDYSLDDGLPATYDDFFALLLYMATGPYHVDPIIWNGQLYYLNEYVLAAYINEAGKKDTLANLNFDGTIVSDLIDTVTINPDGSETITYMEPTAITKDNGYLLSRQESKFRALRFWERLLTNPLNYSSQSFGSALTHTGAQDEFLYSSAMSTKKDIGSIIEGGWWQTEASATMEEMGIQDGSQYSQQNRRLAIMPFPWSSREKQQEMGGKQTALATSDSYIFMNAQTTGAQAEVAKLFIKFACSDRQLMNFVKATGVPTAMKVTPTEADLTEMNYFSKSMLNYQNAADILFPVSKQDFVLNNWSNMKLSIWTWMSKTSSGDTRQFTREFKEGTRTAKEHFDGMYTYSEQLWKTIA